MTNMTKNADAGENEERGRVMISIRGKSRIRISAWMSDCICAEQLATADTALHVKALIIGFRLFIPYRGSSVLKVDGVDRGPFGSVS